MACKADVMALLRTLIEKGQVSVYDAGTGLVQTVDNVAWNGDSLQINLAAQAPVTARVTVPAPTHRRVCIDPDRVPPLAPLDGATCIIGKRTVTIAWSTTKVATGGPRAGRRIRTETSVNVPRAAFAVAFQAWAATEEVE